MSQSKDPTTVDRISDLPDETLCHILSFLPTTKDAFATTFLSKRWNSLCYSLTTLNFEYVTMPYSPDEFNRFIRLIDKFMLSPRVKNQSLKTFRIRCRFQISDSEFYAWIEAAKQRRIEEFHCFIDNHSVTLNPTFFISQTLLVLKLEMLHFKYVNFCFDLPLLKTLCLKYVRFEYENDIKKLLNACPNLQDLHTCHPFYIYPEKNNEAQEFKSLILSKLVRADTNSTHVPLNAISNVEFLRLSAAQDPSLHMNFDDFFKRIPVFQNLIHVKLSIHRFSNFWDGIVHFLQQCPKLQTLYMNKGATNSSKEWDCPISSPKCVSSHLRSCTIVNFQGSKNDLRFATYILQNAGRLEVMTIYVYARSSNGMKQNQIIEELSTCPRMVPGCKLSLQFIN